MRRVAAIRLPTTASVRSNTRTPTTMPAKLKTCGKQHGEHQQPRLREEPNDEEHRRRAVTGTSGFDLLPRAGGDAANERHIDRGREHARQGERSLAA